MDRTHYSTLKEPPIRGSWTVRKVTQRFTSNTWLLQYCCGFCNTRQKMVSTSRPNSMNETGRKKILESAIELQTSSKSRDSGKFATDETSATRHDYGVSKNETQNIAKNERLSINCKDDFLIDAKKFSSDSGTRNSGMKHMIGSLPTISEKDRASIDEKRTSESDSDIIYPANIFPKCSMRYKRQKKASMTNISRLSTS
jgi:hypothetical protein